MLRNRLFMAGLAVLLLLVAYYNVSFFQKRHAGRQQAGPAASPAAGGKAAGASRTAPAAAGYAAAWKRDPFWYPEGRRATSSFAPGERATARRKGGLRLEGTMTKDGKGYVLINGSIYGVGDRVDGYQIMSIGDRSVTMKGATGTRTMRILSEPGGKE